MLTQKPPSPLQRLRHPVFAEADLEVWIKRDDLLQIPAIDNTPAFCGNKWRKLKYNLSAPALSQTKRILTFGGAYSNHIAAVAAVGWLFGYETVGVIRGELHEPLNPTLSFAQRSGMQIHYMDRSVFRKMHTLEVLEPLHRSFGPFHVLPEGGTNDLAVKGCTELGEEIADQLKARPDYLCTSAGTGGTAAGLILGTGAATQVVVFPALKGDFLREEINHWLPLDPPAWTLVTDYHFGGYAKWTQELIDFMRRFTAGTGILLDPIYTGKLLYGVLAEAQKGRFKPGSRLVVVHTGGLQGLVGFEERFGVRLYSPTTRNL